MDPLRLERPHGASGPMFCSKQCQRWIQTRMLRTLSSLQYLQGWWFLNLAIKPVPVLNYPHSELFYYVLLEAPLIQVMAVVPHSHTMQLSKEPGSVFTVTSLQGQADCSLVFLKPSLLLDKLLFSWKRSLLFSWKLLPSASLSRSCGPTLPKNWRLFF